jgi:hypothetical protein
VKERKSEGVTAAYVGVISCRDIKLEKEEQFNEAKY